MAKLGEIKRRVKESSEHYPERHSVTSIEVEFGGPDNAAKIYGEALQAILDLWETGKHLKNEVLENASIAKQDHNKLTLTFYGNLSDETVRQLANHVCHGLK